MLLSKKLWNSIGLLNELLSQQNNLLSIDESKRLARSLNQCIPPDGVYAIGRENSAAGKYIVIEKILASGTIKGCTY